MATELETKCVVISEEEISDEEYAWTISKFESEFFLYLANFKILLDKEGEMVETHPYYDQAHDLMYLIPILKPTPIFEISRSHLSKEIRKRLIEFHKDTTRYPKVFDEAVVNAVGKLFENLNPRYYHQSVRMLLRVMFV